MNTQTLFDTKYHSKAIIALVVCLLVLLTSVVVAWLVQRDFGNVEVSNVRFANENGIPIRAKLLRPVAATAGNPLPGAVYVHGYQNNRETSDPYCIEMARRGFVMLCIDAIGRGNSGEPGDPEAADFDETYGARTSLAYLQALPFVDPARTGLMGHSLGAEMAYAVALTDPSVHALVISGFAYREDATPDNPKNMLMMIGQYDEYRERMTGVSDIKAEWMNSPQTQAAFPAGTPQIGVTYGDFDQGTARRVFVPRAIHIQVSHSSAPVAEAVTWMREALDPPEALWRDAGSQVWHVKEWATLVAMVAAFALLMPLGLLLLRTRLFRPLQGPIGGDYACEGACVRYAVVNGLLMWLYLPLIFVLFGVHVYLVPIDGLFPMMLVNGIVWWFVVINVIGFFLFRRWFKKRHQATGLTLADLGISYRPDRFALDWGSIGRTALLAALLFAFVYLVEHLLEAVFLVDYRFIFPFANDLTAYRFLMFLLYFPFLLLGFLLMAFFVHGQLRRRLKDTWLQTWASWSATNVLAMTVPLILFLAIQYVPLLTVGAIPFTGPGGVLANFTMGLFHIIGVLILVLPLSTWFYQLTGKIYLGAFLNAALVTWMFVSSQVIAPIPV
ncbi:MAG: alpha/beta hydrolase [Anaerolineae bacterium]|nr:alpha/beta hydrolase [Anaerolineae bacterium]